MNEKFEFYIPSSDGLSRIHGYKWDPEGTPKAVLQICHGMTEYIDRYDAFARTMNDAGIAVVGHDHLGHGKTARPGTLGQFARMNGPLYLLNDMRLVSEFTVHQYPGIPHFLMGHSMGSFLARRYTVLRGDELAGVIFMGTGTQPKLVLKLGKKAVDRACQKEGREKVSDKLDRLILGSYNKKFAGEGTDHQWLSRVTESNLRYEADPYCSFRFSNGAYQDFFHVMMDLKEKKRFDQIPKELPVLLVSGDQDPVGNFGKGVTAVCNEFKSLGMSDVSMKLYPGARHELINEVNREEVFADISSWILKRI